MACSPPSTPGTPESDGVDMGPCAAHPTDWLCAPACRPARRSFARLAAGAARVERCKEHIVVPGIESARMCARISLYGGCPLPIAEAARGEPGHIERKRWSSRGGLA